MGRRMSTAPKLAWAVPGLGHFYLGRRRTAVAFLLLVTATFLAGLSFQGRLYTIEEGVDRRCDVATFESLT